MQFARNYRNDVRVYEDDVTSDDTMGRWRNVRIVGRRPLVEIGEVRLVVDRTNEDRCDEERC